MANNNDGQTKESGNQNHSGRPYKITTYGDDGVVLFGNNDAKLLAAKYKELSKDGLSDDDRKKLKKLDKELKGAEFRCMGDDVTLVVQEKDCKETDFVVLGHGLKQDSGFVNPQAKSGRKI